MRVLLYEWCCAGGDGGAIVEEGRAMLEALALDAAKDPALQVTVLASASVPLEMPARTHVCAVPRGRDAALLGEESPRHDWTIVVAPETDGVLADRVLTARQAGGRVAGCSGRFIAIAGDKQQTAVALAAAGVPVPAGRALEAGQALPPGFHRPAVCKARWGVGCDALTIVHGDGQPSISDTPRRVEAFVPGMPVGVSCLCGPASIHALPPMRQRFSAGPAPRYLGGVPLCDRALVSRAWRLAQRSIDALGRSAADADAFMAALGWVGVDMILGDREDGRGERVVEANPRLTTSFVGLAARHRSSLVRAILAAAEGREPELIADEAGGVRVLDATA